MTANHNSFQAAIRQGIPATLPPKHQFPAGVNRAPKRKDILSKEEKHLAIRNALRYFPKEWHTELAQEFTKELQDYGRIYMYRFKELDCKRYIKFFDLIVIRII